MHVLGRGCANHQVRDLLPDTRCDVWFRVCVDIIANFIEVLVILLVLNAVP